MPDENIGAIRPTLFIGLGGTGKEVLLRLRRKFYERLGQPGLPCTAYLWLDTDTRDVMARGEKIDEILEAVTFDEPERIALLSGRVSDDLGEVFRNKDRWRHIHPPRGWLYPAVERYGAEIADGAGGVRAVGRLTFFFHHTHSIDPAIRDILGRIGTLETISKTEAVFEHHKLGKADFEVTPQVFIVCSAAGGTGCGTFLDTAFLLRNLTQHDKVPIWGIYGIIFLPNVYYPNASGELAQRSYGNGYAALKELEFYSIRIAKEGADADKDLTIDYGVEWEPNRTWKIQGPPFRIPYMIEMKNEAGIGLQTRSELFKMVAESLFLDFMPGPFSTYKRSDYSNAAEALSRPKEANIEVGRDDSQQKISLQQQFSRRYGSFGMSKIEIPVDSLKGACAAHLGFEIASYVNREGSDPNIKTNMLDDMAQKQVDADGLLARFGTSWKDGLRNALAIIFQGLTVKEIADVNELEKKLITDEKDGFEAKQIRSEGADPARWGAAIDVIRKTTTTVSRAVASSLLDWIKESIENPSRGLRAFLTPDGYLYYMTQNLKSYYLPPGEGIPAEYDALIKRAEQDAEYWKGQRDLNLGELKASLKSFGLVALGVKDWTIRTLLDRLREAEEQYALTKAERELLLEAKKVAKLAVDFLAEKRPNMERFLEAIASLVQSCESRREGFLMFGEQVLFIQFFDRDRDWDSFYKLDVADDERPRPVNAKDEYRRFLERTLGGHADLWALIEFFGRKGEKEVKKGLTSFCEERFWRDFEAHPRQINVLEHPRLQERLDQAIDKLVRSAMPMVRRETRLGANAVIAQRHVYLGVAQKDGSPFNTFIEKVTQLLQSKKYGDFRRNEIEFLETGKPWEAYLYIVSYAFPLPTLPVVSSECHKAYYDFYKTASSKDYIPLHLSTAWEGRLEDLVVYSGNEAEQIKEAREALLFGALLKVLDIKEVQGGFEYGYKRWMPGASRREPLGTKREAIEQLRNDAPLRGLLLRTIGQRESALTKEQTQSYYWALLYLRFSGVFPFGSPDGTLLDNRSTEIHNRLMGMGVPEDSLSLDAMHIPEAERANKAKELASQDVEWIGAFPTLKSLEQWAKAVGEA
jgi:hypothetical protein